MQFGLSERVVAELRSVFLQFPNIEKVIIFGSRAKGEYREGSDIDLAVCAPKMDLREKTSIINKIDDLMLLYKVDVVDYYAKEGTPIYDHINRVGKRFYTKQ